MINTKYNKNNKTRPVCITRGLYVILVCLIPEAVFPT